MTENFTAQHVPFPKNLLIETTTRCNLRCKQCARIVNKYPIADIEMETFYRLAPLFPHVQEVALYGHGETFLHKQFFTMLEELKKHGIFVYVTTNGTLLTEEIVERIVALHLDRLSFSLDAATPELFNEIRRGADFGAILANIRRLNMLKKQLHRDDQPVLSIMYCAMQSNIHELSKLIRLADQLNMTHGVAVINIVEYEAEGERLTRYPELAERYFNEARLLAAKLAIPLDIPGSFDVHWQPIQVNAWDRVYRNYREFRRSFNRPALLRIKWDRLLARAKSLVIPQHPAVDKGDSPPESSTQPSPMIRVKQCRDPWEFMFVNVHGDVRVCCVSHRVMGNVTDEDVLAIWNNDRYQTFRSQMLTADPPEECQTCPMRGWHVIPAHDAERR